MRFFGNVKLHFYAFLLWLGLSAAFYNQRVNLTGYLQTQFPFIFNRIENWVIPEFSLLFIYAPVIFIIILGFYKIYGWRHGTNKSNERLDIVMARMETLEKQLGEIRPEITLLSENLETMVDIAYKHQKAESSKDEDASLTDAEINRMEVDT